MKNNNSHPGPEMYAEDMPVETLDVLGLVAQVTKMVNDIFSELQILLK